MSWGSVVLFLLLLPLCMTCSNLAPKKFVDYSCIAELKDEELSKDERARRFTVDIEISDELSQRDYERMMVAGQLVGVVIRSEKFRQAVLNYVTPSGHHGFLNTELTGEQVYDRILDGAELYNGKVNHRMEFVVKTFDPKEDEGNVIAFVRAKGKYVSFSTKYLYHNATRRANTMMHEWLHLIGFDHEKEYTTSRDYSVPYAIGDIVQDIASEYYDFTCSWM